MTKGNRIMRESDRRSHTMLKYRAPLALAVAAMTVASCDLVVDPSVDVPPEVATGDISGVRSLVTHVYGLLRNQQSYGEELMQLGDLMADNARVSSPPVNRTGHYANTIGSHMGDWSDFYDGINEANFTIAAARELTDEEPQEARRYLGEALFLRALIYFDLSRIFAYEPGRSVNGWETGVVLRTEPTRTAGDADFRARATVNEVYQQMEQDLLESIDLLTQYGGNDVYRATQAAAEALLAKIYLYWERWDDAITYATDALSHTGARLAEPGEVASMYTSAPNVESLFEVNIDGATETIWVNDCKGCYTWPHGTWFSMWPSDELLALFEPDDARQALYPACPTGCPSTAPGGVRYVNKYTYSKGDWTDNSPVIRYAEVLLFRAEAYAETGQDALALDDLNALREKRNASEITAGGAALLDAIREERRRELAFEGSSRWFDLKRWGMDIPKPAFQGNPMVPYTDFRLLAQIPDTQVENNPMLEQNPGY